MTLFNRIPWDVVFGGCVTAMCLYNNEYSEVEFKTTHNLIAFSLNVAKKMEEVDMDMTIILITKNWASACKI